VTKGEATMMIDQETLFDELPELPKRSARAVLNGASNFERIAGDAYDTVDPQLHRALARELHRLPGGLFECSVGRGCLLDGLAELGYPVAVASDIAPRRADIAKGDFLSLREMPARCRSIVSNVPFSHIDEMARHALVLTKPVGGGVVLLAPITFISARSRRDLFEHPAFAGQVICAFRVDWFPEHRKGPLPPTIYVWLFWLWERAPSNPFVTIDFGARAGVPAVSKTRVRRPGRRPARLDSS
jgi:hypothetical protein